MSSSSWDRQSPSWRALALVVALVVAAVTLVPGGWASLRPGSAQAQVTDEPPPQEEPKDGRVSEFLEAAKLSALASGNVIAGPAQVIIPAGQTTRDFGDTLWRYENGLGPGPRNRPSMDVTLTVQTFGGCSLNFAITRDPREGEGVDRFFLEIGPSHDPIHGSQGLTVPRAREIRYTLSEPATSDCLFLWVIRETPAGSVKVSRSQ